MRHLLIVGAGKAGSAIAAQALDLEWSVHVIDVRADHLTELAHRLGPAQLTHGSGTDVQDLERAGIRRCDVVVAATGADEVNLVVATLAKFEFATPTVMARVADPRNRWMFESDLGVDIPLDATQSIVDAVLDRVSTDHDEA